jgi:hypothetical protein
MVTDGHPLLRLIRDDPSPQGTPEGQTDII